MLCLLLKKGVCGEANERDRDKHMSERAKSSSGGDQEGKTGERPGYKLSKMQLLEHQVLLLQQLQLLTASSFLQVLSPILDSRRHSP